MNVAQLDIRPCYNDAVCFYNKCEMHYSSFVTYNSVSNDSGQKELKRMKAGIHPNYKKATVKCACGNDI